VENFPKEKSRFLLPGPAGLLEVATTRPSIEKPIIVIICHPNPQHEGTMDNKVVTTIMRAYEHLGLATVRFNYRGVGKSEGSYGEVVGEIDDLRCVLEWVQKVLPGDEIWFAGFSFGSFIAASVANQTHIPAQLLSVAPATNWHDFTTLTDVRCPWEVISSDADEIVPFDHVKPWLDSPPSPLQYHVVHDASHFFHGRLIELREMIEGIYVDRVPKDS
jgi:uncharacterized protein